MNQFARPCSPLGKLNTKLGAHAGLRAGSYCSTLPPFRQPSFSPQAESQCPKKKVSVLHMHRAFLGEGFQFTALRGRIKKTEFFCKCIVLFHQHYHLEGAAHFQWIQSLKTALGWAFLDSVMAGVFHTSVHLVRTGNNQMTHDARWAPSQSPDVHMCECQNAH